MKEATLHLTRSLFFASSSLFTPPPFRLTSTSLSFRLLSSIYMSSAAPQSQPLTATTQQMFGFKRKEMYSEPLAGTVKGYDRHVFLCFKNPESWGPRVEIANLDLPLLPSLLYAAFKDRMDRLSLKTNLTVCGPASGNDLVDGDVLIFPDMIRYRGLGEANVDSFVEDVLVNNLNWGDGVPESIDGTYVFVCAHGNRDKRCGVCGPVLIDKFNEEIVANQMKDRVHVSPCSHIGGHKYAGNLIIYGRDLNGKATGHWYGYVTPEDVHDVIDSHIKMGTIIQRLWRGQIGSTTDGLIMDGSAKDKMNDQ